MTSSSAIITLYGVNTSYYANLFTGEDNLMRKELATKAGERRKFSALFIKFGTKANYHGYSEETILLKHVVDLETNQLVADHVWFSYTKSFQQLLLTEGTKILFDARVKEYTKGYVNKQYKIDQRTRDFRLSHPTQVKLPKPT